MCGLFIEQKSALVGKCFSVKLEKTGILLGIKKKRDLNRKTGQSLVRLYIAHNGLFCLHRGGAGLTSPGSYMTPPRSPTNFPLSIGPPGGSLAAIWPLHVAMSHYRTSGEV